MSGSGNQRGQGGYPSQGDGAQGSWNSGRNPSQGGYSNQPSGNYQTDGYNKGQNQAGGPYYGPNQQSGGGQKRPKNTNKAATGKRKPGMRKKPQGGASPIDAVSPNKKGTGSSKVSAGGTPNKNKAGSKAGTTPADNDEEGDDNDDEGDDEEDDDNGEPSGGDGEDEEGNGGPGEGEDDDDDADGDDDDDNGDADDGSDVSSSKSSKDGSSSRMSTSNKQSSSSSSSSSASSSATTSTSGRRKKRIRVTVVVDEDDESHSTSSVQSSSQAGRTVGTECAPQTMHFSSYAGRCLPENRVASCSQGKRVKIDEDEPTPDSFCEGRDHRNYPHPHCPSRYVSCHDKKALERHCPHCNTDPVTCPHGKLQFNKYVGDCVWANETEIGKDEEGNVQVISHDEENPSFRDVCLDKGCGNFAHPLTCRMYLSCKEGVVLERQCPSCFVDKKNCPRGQLYFSEKEDACLPAGEVSACVEDGKIAELEFVNSKGEKVSRK